MAPFHDPLDRSRREIRLLAVQSSGPEICCEIETCSLNDDIEYIALSYASGAGSPTRPIQFDGFDIEVGESLYTALEFFRAALEPDTERVIWADAICINQDDDEEKNWQVQQMRFVYQQALSVCVWLGRAS